MSTNARAEARRQERSRAKAQRQPTWDGTTPEGWGTTAGWCDEASIELAKKQTHDTLIALMGDRRIGGVQWRIHTGQEAVEALGVLRKGATGEHADYYRQIGAHLREYGGYLVVAMAPGRDDGWVSR